MFQEGHREKSTEVEQLSDVGGGVTPSGHENMNHDLNLKQCRSSNSGEMFGVKALVRPEIRASVRHTAD